MGLAYLRSPSLAHSLHLSFSLHFSHTRLCPLPVPRGPQCPAISTGTHGGQSVRGQNGGRTNTNTHTHSSGWRGLSPRGHTHTLCLQPIWNSWRPKAPKQPATFPGQKVRGEGALGGHQGEGVRGHGAATADRPVPSVPVPPSPGEFQVTGG